MVDKILPGLPAPLAGFLAHLVTLLCQRRLSLHARQNDNGDYSLQLQGRTDACSPCSGSIVGHPLDLYRGLLYNKLRFET